MSETPITPLPNEVQPPRAGEQTKFATDLVKVVSGTTIAQIIGILTTPLITRLYSPDAFGVFALFTSIVNILVVVYTLQYESAIVLPKSDSDAANLTTGTLYLTVLGTLLTIPVVWWGGPVIVELLNAPELTSYLWFIPLFLLFGGMGAGHPVINAWARRIRHFKEVSIVVVIGAISSTTVKLIAGFLGLNSAGGLLGGALFGSLLPPIILGPHLWQHNRKLLLESVQQRSIIENLKRYRNFPIYSAPSALLHAISSQVPSFFLAAFFSPAVAGYYAFSNQLLRGPMGLIGGSIADVFHPHVTQAFHEGTLAEFVEKTFRRLVEYSFFPMLMLMVIGKELVLVVFGRQWAEAGVYVQILSLWTIFWFISSPISRLYYVLEKNKAIFLFQIMILVTRVVSLWLGGVMQNPRMALILFSLSGAIMYAYLSVSILFLAGVSWAKIGWILFQNLTIFAVAGACILLLKVMHVSDWAQVLTAGLFIGCYFAYRLRDKIQYAWAFRSSVRRLFDHRQ